MVARALEADALSTPSGDCGTPNPSHQEVISVLQRTQFRREEGQTMAEYGVVLAVVTALVFGALALLSTNIGAALTRVAGLVGVGNG
jgi:Flp pilus assembly pilin Flp